MDVTTQGDERSIETDPKEPTEPRSETPELAEEPLPVVPDLSRTQLGYLRSVLWLPGE